MSIALPIPLIRTVGAAAGEAAVVAVDGAEPTPLIPSVDIVLHFHIPFV